MNDPIGTIRERRENNSGAIYIKTNQNQWTVVYYQGTESFVSTCSDKVATIWPVKQ